jgi:hypothetical protein
MDPRLKQQYLLYLQQQQQRHGASHQRGKIDTPKNDTFIYLFEHIFLSLD